MPALIEAASTMIRGKDPVARIRTLWFVLVLVVLAGAAHAAGWPKGDIPYDPALRLGVLSNGMRYAILRNANPTGAVSIRFAIAAGARQESAAQKGLAHFLEHMAFRGSAHVADGEINHTLERLGLRLGADTNAFTGQEQTVYKFDLPRDDASSLDAALNFMREIAGELTLDPAAARTEAGVVLSELKLRDTPSFRAASAQLEFVLQDPHAAALPNGDPAIVAQAPVAEMRAFYDAYYRPERATLVVVGDVEPGDMEARIKACFAQWRGRGRAGADPRIAIALSRPVETRVFSERDATPQASLSWLLKATPRPNDKALDRWVQINLIGLRVLNMRLQEAAASTDPPFLNARISRGSEPGIADSVTLSISHAPGRWQAAVAAAEKIRLDLLRTGVSEAEVERAISERRAAFVGAKAAASTRSTPGLADIIVSNAATGDIFIHPADRLTLLEETLKTVSAEEVNRVLRDDFPDHGPLIFLSGPEPVPGGEPAVTEAFRNIEQQALAATPLARAQHPVLSWPYNDFGKPGQVAETRQVPDLGVTFLRFANGVRLTVRPSQLRANQVLVSVKVGDGQLSLPKDRITAAWAAGALPGGGLEAMSALQVQQVLAASNYRVDFRVDEDGFVFSGQTTPGDIDIQLKVLAAYLTAPGFRPEGFELFRNARAQRLRQAEATPMAVMQLKTPEILHGGDKRWATPEAQDIQAVKVEDLSALLKPVFAKGAIDVTITGNVTVEKAIESVAATFGALPPRAQTRAAVSAGNSVNFPTGGEPVIAIPGSIQAGQQILGMVWPTHGTFPDLKENAALNLLGAVMRERLSDKLRGSGTVYVSFAGNLSSRVFDYGYLQALAQLPPEGAGKFRDAVAEIVRDLKAGKLSEDDLARAKNPAIAQLTRSRETNDYWLAVLDGAQEKEERLDAARNYQGYLQQVTVADIQAAAGKYLIDARRLEVAIGAS
ncbi:MAG TPA: insulinase family protein [Rhizomicrobium sp.]|nr:insulinase family protein [Rhizomicrobium sp.]